MSRRHKHPLAGLLIAQFMGAFNDNAWKLFVALLAMREALKPLSDPLEREAAFQTATMKAFLLLTLPILLVSLPAGALADRISKRRIIVTLKAVEILLMLLATVSLYFSPTSAIPVLTILAFMGLQSGLFGPAKYGILPELLPHQELSSGNAYLEMWSIVAIVFGTAAGGILLGQTGEALWLAGLPLVLLAVIGFFASFQIPHVQPARSDGGVLKTVRIAWAAIRADRVMWLTVLGTAYYWFLANLVGQNVLVYTKSVLKLPDTYSGMPLAVFGLGVGFGCIGAGRISRAKVELGLIPLGATGLFLFLLGFGLWAPGVSGTLFLMGLLGISSGLLLIPLNAILQWRSPRDCCGAVIAFSRVLTFAGMVAGTISAKVLSQLLPGIRPVLVCISLITLAGTLWALYLLPEAFLRLVLILLTHTIYRLRILGRQHLPQEGGALLVPNHVSLVDGLFLLASTDRQIRFIVESSYFERFWLKPLMKGMGAIPISGAGGIRVVLRALRNAGTYLDEGELVCIFAEGQMTRNGILLPFRRGFERIARGRMAPIIPVHLDRVWGSIFSRERGRFITKLPRRIPYPVTVSFGSPLPSGTPVHEVRQAVMEIGQEAWECRKGDLCPVHRRFVWSTRRHPFRLVFAEAGRTYVPRVKALAGAVALARALRHRWADQKNIGVLLPCSIGAGLINLAVSLSGRTAVHLNFTTGQASFESALRQAGLNSVISNREFLEKIGLELPDDLAPVWLEDVAGELSFAGKLGAGAAALLLPVGLLERFCGAKRSVGPEETATIIFSSGSTGEPKGVLLSHFNIASNVEALAQVFHAQQHDRLLGILPLFHSFGSMSFWFALDQDIAIVFHPNPLDAAGIGSLVQQFQVTMMLSTPTFLRIYLRRCTPAQFGSLRLVLTGAEKLPDRLSLAFEEQFGIRPLEGYGVTECSPVIATSTLDFRAPGFFQPGSRRGCVGHPLPGVAVRIVDPDSHEILPPDTAGMILVKGPNVMQGYLNREDLTREAMLDGWYVTGDIGMMSEDGFLKITDRLSRFSKIGGEMVPHGRVEEALHEAAGREEQLFAVTAVPDSRKGESLAVLHTLADDEILPILEKLPALGLPNLFIPRKEQFIKVKEIPRLGTGKLDLKEMRRIARDAAGIDSGARPA